MWTQFMDMPSGGPSMGVDGFHVDCQAGRLRWQNVTVCDKYERQCAPGSDGLANCPVEKE